MHLWISGPLMHLSWSNTEEDVAGQAGHPEWVGNLNLTLDRDPWSFFWGMNFVGETDNTASFGRTTVTSFTDEEVRAGRRQCLRPAAAAAHQLGDG